MLFESHPRIKNEAHITSSVGHISTRPRFQSFAFPFEICSNKQRNMFEELCPKLPE
jgi:hypothetical protein